MNKSKKNFNLGFDFSDSDSENAVYFISNNMEDTAKKPTQSSKTVFSDVLAGTYQSYAKIYDEVLSEKNANAAKSFKNKRKHNKLESDNKMKINSDGPKAKRRKINEASLSVLKDFVSISSDEDDVIMDSQIDLIQIEEFALKHWERNRFLNLSVRFSNKII